MVYGVGIILAQMDRIKIRESAAPNSNFTINLGNRARSLPGLVEIAIRPPLWPFSTVLASTALAWALWKIARLPSSSVHMLMTLAIVVAIGSLVLAPFIVTEDVSIDNRSLSICQRIFGVGMFLKTYSLSEISNLRYDPRPYIANKAPMVTIAFEYSTDLGISHRFGRSISEADARQVIQIIEARRSIITIRRL